MPRTHLRHLAAAAAATLGIAFVCAPVAWLHLGAAGLTVVAACGLAILTVALLSDALVWLVGGMGGSPTLWMVCGAACRMVFVIGVMIFALKASPTEFTGVAKPYVAIYLVPFYFGLLAVEVFTAKTILSVSPPPRA